MRTQFSFGRALALVFVMMGMLSLSSLRADNLRGGLATVLAKLWSPLAQSHAYLLGNGGEAATEEQYIHALEVDRLLLREELEHLHSSQAQTQALYQRDITLIKPARVIARDRKTWNNCLWIDVGTEANPLIRQDCPVTQGIHLVGVIDYAGARQSRVRLITDPRLNPSVRATRGQSCDLESASHLDALEILLEQRESSLTKEALQILREELDIAEETRFLAKGELRGAHRKDSGLKAPRLLGSGFNYDFADQYGPARDLRSGRPLGQSQAKPLALVQVGDLLVTTGMDGVFPEGLSVAYIDELLPLKNGAYYSELLARPSAGDLDRLHTLLVLAPLGFDPHDKAPHTR